MAAAAGTWSQAGSAGLQRRGQEAQALRGNGVGGERRGIVDARSAVLNRAKEAAVAFVHLQFSDILGLTKTVAIPISQLERALAGEIMFDAASIDGFVRMEESDMFLLPDPETFAVFPWTAAEGATGRLICDICLADGSPFAGCARTRLKVVLAEAEAAGFHPSVGAEPEFFLLPLDAHGRPRREVDDRAGYFDQGPIGAGDLARQEMVGALDQMGLAVETAHHEAAPGQHEIDFAAAPALRAADNIATFRLVVRTIAMRHQLHATFMPKPFFGRNGSGLHLHHALMREGKDAFAGEGGLSQEARSFVAGLLSHMRGLTAITNPLVNSYKRLIMGYEAPAHISWSDGSKSPLLRVSHTHRGLAQLELRSPDPTCNPYLALAVCLKAGLAGIREHLEPPPPLTQSPQRMNAAELRELGVERLPGSLREALDHLRQDGLVREALGEHIYRHFLEAKEIEWEVYERQVNDWEVDQYLETF